MERPDWKPVLDWVQRNLGALGESVVLSDPNEPGTPIVHVSARFSDMTGYSLDECVGRNCRFLQGPGTDSHAVARIKEAVVAKRVHTEEILNYKKSGEPFWNRLHLAPLTNENGEVVFLVGVQHDVTALRLLEERVSRSTQETLRAKSETRSMNELSLSVAHEINTPLTIVDGRIQMALMSLSASPPELEAVRRFLGEASAGLHRLARVIASLKAFALADSRVPSTPASLQRILEDAFKKVQCRVANREILWRFPFRGAQSALSVFCDRPLLVEAFASLLEAALQARHEDLSCPVSVSVELQEAAFHGLAVRIESNGRFVPPESSVLALCRVVFERHGGTLTGDASGETPAFLVTLPRFLLGGAEPSLPSSVSRARTLEGIEDV